MTAVLFTRPEHDVTTLYLSQWCKQAMALTEEKGFTVIDLPREKAVRKEVEDRLRKSSPRLVVLNGHGNDQMVTGHKNEPLLIAGENENLLQGKIVYAISCRSAKRLGVKSVEAGVLNYTGYADDFVFLYEPHQITRPLSDKTAEQFLKHSQMYVESLLKGNTTEESFQRSQQNLKMNFIKALNEQNTGAARFLWWDWKHYVSLGQKVKLE